MSEEGAAPAVDATSSVAAGALGVSDAPASDGAQGSGESAWHDGMGLSGETVQLFEAKGWSKAENPLEELSKGYRNLERLRGVPGDQLVRIPEPGNEEQVAEFRQRLGVPDSAEGYEIPDYEVDGRAVDKAAIAKIAHALNATPEQAARLPELVGFLGKSAMAEDFANKQAAGAAANAEWQQGQGQALEQNTLLADKGFGTAGITVEMLDAIRGTDPDAFKSVMDLAVLAGRGMAEHRRGDGDAGGGSAPSFGLTREEAKRLIASEGPELAQRIASGDKSASRRLKDLNTAAHY